MTYFKYDNGNAFTLNGIPYSGFFNVGDDGSVYTGKNKNNNSEALSSKGTYLGDFYTTRLEFDNSYSDIDGVDYQYPTKMDVLDKNEITKLFDYLNLNNLKVFKSLTIRNKQIINFQNQNSHFYGLSSNSGDEYGEDTPSAKNVRTHIDPFSMEEKWEYIDRVKVGTILVDVNNNFKYLCSTGTDIITLSGSFTNKTPLAQVRYENIPQPDLVYQISHDEEDDKIFIVRKDEVFVYEASNYINCGELLLVDRIPLIPTPVDTYKFSSHIKFGEAQTKFSNRYVFKNPNNPEFIKFGKNLRTSIENGFLRLYNKFTNDYIAEYSFEGYPLSIAIRNVDDFIAILVKKDEKYSVYYVDTINESISSQNIEQFDHDTNASVKFTNFDSNIIYTTNLKQIQMRNITKSEYPFAFITESNLLYPQNLKFGEAYSRFGDIKRKWNTKKMDSNNFNNILIDAQNVGGTFHIFLHNSGRIYAMKQAISDLNRDNLPQDLTKTYSGVSTSESSFGLYINTNLRKIVEDLFTLYQKTSRIYKYSKDDVIDDILEDINVDIENFYMQGNETFNSLVFRRIIKNIVDFQKMLISQTTNLNN